MLACPHGIRSKVGVSLRQFRERTENAGTNNKQSLKHNQMNRLSRYSFASANNSTANNTEPRKRTILAATSFLESLKAAEGIAPYVFESNEEAQKFFAENITNLSIRVSELDNGNARNKAIATLKSGKVYNLRVFGTDKTAVAESEINDKTALSALKFGYCKTSGEYVTSDGVNPTLYVDISALV